MDGARFANACASLNCSPAEMTWKAGVDLLCFGGTKNGMAVGEAVIFFDRELAADFDYRCKQAGQLASKMRFLAAPWVGMLEGGAWLKNAAHANACARRLAIAVADLPDFKLMFPVRPMRPSSPRPKRNWRRCASAAGASIPLSAAARASCSHGMPIPRGSTRWPATSGRSAHAG